MARIIVEQVICRFGTPLSIVTDCAKDLDGDLMREICRLLDVDKLRSTAYKASTNAAAERFHRTLNIMIGRMIDEHHRDWDSLLQYVMAAYRSSRHEATHFTPNYLMMGREVRAPVDIVYAVPETAQPSTYDDYADELHHRMTSAYSLVRENLQEEARRSKRYYDMRVRTQRYYVGDWVYYYNPHKYVVIDGVCSELHKNPPITFCISLLTDKRHTDKPGVNTQPQRKVAEATVICNVRPSPG